MKYFLKCTLSIFVLAIVFLTTGIAEAKELPSRPNVPVTKPWKITFSQEVVASEISHNDLYVIDSEGNRVGLYIVEGSSPNQVEVTPRTGYYQAASEYTLYIEPFESKSGVMLNDTYTMSFTTEELNKNQIAPTEVAKIENTTDDTLEIYLTNSDPKSGVRYHAVTFIGFEYKNGIPTGYIQDHDFNFGFSDSEKLEIGAGQTMLIENATAIEQGNIIQIETSEPTVQVELDHISDRVFLETVVQEDEPYVYENHNDDLTWFIMHVPMYATYPRHVNYVVYNADGTLFRDATRGESVRGNHRFQIPKNGKVILEVLSPLEEEAKESKISLYSVSHHLTQTPKIGDSVFDEIIVYPGEKFTIRNKTNHKVRYYAPGPEELKDDTDIRYFSISHRNPDPIKLDEAEISVFTNTLDRPRLIFAPKGLLTFEPWEE